MHEQAQEEEIIRQVLQGNVQAFAHLVQQYQNYVFTLVQRYVPGREEAEEIAQDVFVKAYRSLADFRGQCKFSTWLYTIVNTTCISALRKKKAPTLLMDEEKMIFVADQSHSADNNHKRLEIRSERKIIQSAIAQLPPTDAQIITLFYLHEQSLAEVATILGLTTNHVKVRLHRARGKLKEILERKSNWESLPSLSQ